MKWMLCWVTILTLWQLFFMWQAVCWLRALDKEQKDMKEDLRLLKQKEDLQALKAKLRYGL
jgi:type VI protein secretion system component VasK